MRVLGIQPSVVVGVIAVRYIFLPLIGIAIVRGALSLGLVRFDPLYLFILLLQYALPPAMNIGKSLLKYFRSKHIFIYYASLSEFFSLLNIGGSHRHHYATV